MYSKRCPKILKMIKLDSAQSGRSYETVKSGRSFSYENKLTTVHFDESDSQFHRPVAQERPRLGSRQNAN